MGRLVSGDWRSVVRTGTLVFSLFLLSIVYRLPVLIHARGLNSDVAVVGLQALHMGELDPFLWGSGYQSAADSFVAWLFFAVMGPSPLALVLSAFVLHLLVTALVFFILSSVVRDSMAWLLTLPLVFASASVHSYALNPPREASIALVFIALALALRPSDAAPRVWRSAFAFLVLGLSLAADPYARLMFPAALLWLVLFSLRDRAQLIAHGAIYLCALLIGLIPELLLRTAPRASSGPMSFDVGRFASNARLLFEACGPWALGGISYAPKNVMDYERFAHSGPIATLQLAGLIGYWSLIVLSTLALLRASRTPRIITGTSLLVLMLTIAGFLVSVMVFDHFAMRYLATMTLFAPFMFAAAARALPKPLVIGLVLVHVSATAISGWTAFRPYVDGPHLVTSPVGARKVEDEALWQALDSAGVHYAMADYWASYRLTFLRGEKTIVVPTHAREDRYAPYRHAFESAEHVAYIHDQYRSRESVQDARMFAEALGRVRRQVTLGPYTVFDVVRATMP